MNALLLTPDQATALENANGDSIRRLAPRQLNDGRLILAADVLEDPLFNDPAQPWLPILLAATPIELSDADLAEPSLP